MHNPYGYEALQVQMRIKFDRELFLGKKVAPCTPENTVDKVGRFLHTFPSNIGSFFLQNATSSLSEQLCE
jgi:hypothetical protein